MPDITKSFWIKLDTFLVASEAVLQQEDRNSQWHACGYIFQTFNMAEQNYEIYNRKLLGVVQALKAWRHYLKGALHPVVI